MIEIRSCNSPTLLPLANILSKEAKLVHGINRKGKSLPKADLMRLSRDIGRYLALHRAIDSQVAEAEKLSGSLSIRLDVLLKKDVAKD